MAKIKELRDKSNEFFKKGGDVGRQLALAALGAIWIFKVTSSPTSTDFALPKALYEPAYYAMLALGLDLAHILLQAFLWSAVSFWKEQTAGTDDADAGDWNVLINVPAILLMLSKFFCLGISYWLLLKFLHSAISFSK